MRIKLSRPSPALVISVIALIAALTGSAYAVNKIGTKQLKKNAVSTQKIKPGAVTTPKIRPGAVTESRLATSERGKAVAYATVNANGTVVADKSRGITDAMITKPGGATGVVFCFHGLPSGTDTIQATGIWDGATEFEGPTVVIAAKAPLPDVDCSTVPGTQYAVLTYNPQGAGAFADRAFQVAFFR